MTAPRTDAQDFREDVEPRHCFKDVEVAEDRAEHRNGYAPTAAGEAALALAERIHEDVSGSSGGSSVKICVQAASSA